MKDLEFYADTSGSVYVSYPDGTTKMIRENSRDIITDLLSMISDLKPDTYDALMDTYSKYSKNKVYYEFRMAQRYIRCNWPRFDNTKKDIDSDGHLNGEPFFCPLRDECQLSGIVCNSRINTTLTEREKEVFALIAEGLQAEAIANRLFLSIHTINRHRENIKVKIEVRSVAEMVAWWHKNKP